MKTEWVMVSPAMAKSWLSSLNTNNRSLARSKVIQYAADMRAGNWTPSHQGIAFYEDGVLADGQHRLAACIEADFQMWTPVTYGIPRSSAAGIDCHRARKMDDQIKIAGMSDWIKKDELAVAKLLRRCATGSATSGTMSSHQAVAFCNAHKEAIKSSTSALSVKVRSITVAPVMAGAACAYAHIGAESHAKFCDVLQSGIMTEPSDIAAIRLRERLLSDGRAMQSSDSGRIDVVRLTMRAIKAFHDREKITRLQIPAGFVYPILEIPE